MQTIKIIPTSKLTVKWLNTNLDTHQKVFDYIATHLFRQGKPSWDGDNCLYRMGRYRCAVGVVIPNSEYTSNIEGLSFFDVGRVFSEKFNNWTSKFFTLLYDLQKVHDSKDEEVDFNWESTERIRGALFEVATSHNLNMDYVNNLRFKTDS